jgi:resolvase-like protein
MNKCFPICLRYCCKSRRDATKRQFDLVMAWSVDRLGRSLKDLVAFLSELHALRIDLFLHQQGLDTTTPAGKMTGAKQLPSEHFADYSFVFN